jgi:hypothetical protein
LSLRFTLAPAPQRWGTAPADAPPSYSPG